MMIEPAVSCCPPPLALDEVRALHRAAMDQPPRGFPGPWAACGLLVFLLMGSLLVARLGWLFACLAVPSYVCALVLASILQHECTHRSLLRFGWLNSILGHWLGLVVWTPFGSFRRGHHAHHRWLGSATGKDPTASPHTPVAPNRWLDLLLMLRVPVLFWAGVWWPYFGYDLRPTAGRRRWSRVAEWLISVVALMGFQALLAWFLGWPGYLILTLGGFMGWSLVNEQLFTRHQHVGLLPMPADQASYTPAQQLNQTRSLRSRLGALLLHFNLHKEHHLFPSLHYRFLPIVQRLLRQRRPDLYAYTRETAGEVNRRAHELLSPTEGDPCPGPTSI